MSEAYTRHREAIRSLLDERFYPLAWLDSQVLSGAIRTMSNETSIIGFEVRTYPGGARELHGMFAAGDMAGVKFLVGEAEKFGREQGCNIATIESREGWAKVFPGYRAHQLRIMKELGDGN